MNPATRFPQTDETRETAAVVVREAANDTRCPEDADEARRARLLAAIWSAIDGE